MAKNVSARIKRAVEETSPAATDNTTGEAKGLLSALEFVSATKPQRAIVAVDPTMRARARLIAAIDQQIASVEALLEGKPFQPTRLVGVKGQRGMKTERQIRFTPWYWQANNTYFLLVKYGTRILPLGDGKAIKIGDASRLTPVLELIKEAVSTGELDEMLRQTAANIGRRKKAI